MASDKLNAMLQSMRARLAGEATHQPISQQLDILLDSGQPFLPAAWAAGQVTQRCRTALTKPRSFIWGWPKLSSDQPAGPVGMAQLAMRRKAWGEALVFWDEVISALR
jgi:hypothetical protein